MGKNTIITMPTEYINILNILDSNPNGLTLFDILYHYQEKQLKPPQNTQTMNRKLYSMAQSKIIRFIDKKDKTYFLTEKGKKTLTKGTK